jgi:hypothetical protein
LASGAVHPGMKRADVAPLRKFTTVQVFERTEAVTSVAYVNRDGEPSLGGWPPARAVVPLHKPAEYPSRLSLVDEEAEAEAEAIEHDDARPSDLSTWHQITQVISALATKVERGEVAADEAFAAPQAGR